MIEISRVSVDRTDLLHLSLAPAQRGNLIAFAAVADGIGGAHVFLNQAARADDIATPDMNFAPTQIAAMRDNAGLYLHGQLPLNARQVTVTCNAESLTLAVSDAQPDLLAGKDCVLTTLNQALSVPAHNDDTALNPLADPAYVANWLSHHNASQDATAAVFFNRLGPNGEGIDFAKRLGHALGHKASAMSQIIVLDIPAPTGRHGEGDERHLKYAPDAPGKNRMDMPDPDPWRSVLGDEILLEFLRHALLSHASGVAYLDLSDWLAPAETASTVFETARAARPDPLIQLTGLNAFAWKLPNDGSATPGDHICRPFDLKSNFSRWVFCPIQARNVPAVWRPHRIIGLQAQPAPQHQLWRMTALRHPGAAPSQIVPKSSLREHPGLLALSQNTFNHSAFRVPRPAIAKEVISIPAAERGDKVVLVTAMKNEGPFLLEWIAYHRAIGVTDFIVFTNDCTDGTDDLLDLLAHRGIVEHYPNPFREMGLKPQHAGFRAAEQLDTVKSADWLMTSDVDEFINVHVGDGHLRDLFAAMGDANMISCTWRLFGNGDIATFEDGFLLRQFTRCAAKTASRPHQAWGFKTLYQNNGIFRKLGVHRPKGLHGAAVSHLNWVNGSGKPMPAKDFRSGWRSNTDTIGYDLVSLNHYAVRSSESFLVKRDRGRVNHVDRDQGEAYWFRMNHNTIEDTSIQRMIPSLTAQWDQLMADEKIAAAHAHCVSCHRAKIIELKAQSTPRAFYDTLNSDRYRTLSRVLPAFGSNVFLAGPDCVPQELVDRFADQALPEDFHFTVDPPVQTEH